MKKASKEEDSPNDLTDGIVGATLAVFGAAVIATPFFGFAPIVVVSTTYLGICVVVRVLSSD
jgi:hypothetical protein